MTRTRIIQRLIEHFKYKSYLEIGINNGANFNKINIDFKESVDPALGIYSHARPTYRMTSDEFFYKFPNKKYDIIFIDGLHEQKQVDKDIINSLSSLTPNGTVVVHDCNPVTETAQSSHYMGQDIWNGDVWKSIVRFNYNNFNEYSVKVVDTDHGVGIIRNQKGKCDYCLPENLSYEWLVDNREKSLNLISVTDFTNLYSV